MAHTRRTLTLTKEWDLTLDGVGRIALTRGAQATAQGVANEARLFTDDAYFIQDRGIPHFVSSLGRSVSTSVLRSYLRRAALLHPDVKEVTSVELTAFDPLTRTISGDIRMTTVADAQGASLTTSF